MVAYSALCDQSPLLYLAYLAATVTKVDDGTTLEQLVGDGGCDGVGASGGGGGDYGGGFVGVFDRLCDAARRGVEVGVVDFPVTRRIGGVVGDVGGDGRCGTVSDAGLAGCDASGDRHGVGRGVKFDDGGAVGHSRTWSSKGSSDGRLVADAVVGDLSGQPALTGQARRRAKRREARRKARAEAASSKVADGGVTPAVEPGVVDLGCSEVPLWRRKSPSANYHTSFFSGCSADVKKRLAESRARALITQNEVAARRSEALLKSQLVERRVEASRLAVDLKVKNSYEQTFGDGGTGFAETVVSAGLESVIPTPGMSSGSVSPDSSVSVAVVRKMEELLKRQAEENAELRRKNGALESSVREKSTGAEVESRKWKSPFEIERENYEYMDQRFAEMEKQGSILSYTEYCNRFYEGGAGPTPGYTMKPDGIAYHIP